MINKEFANKILSESRFLKNVNMLSEENKTNVISLINDVNDGNEQALNKLIKQESKFLAFMVENIDAIIKTTTSKKLNSNLFESSIKEYIVGRLPKYNLSEQISGFDDIIKIVERESHRNSVILNNYFSKKTGVVNIDEEMDVLVGKQVILKEEKEEEVAVEEKEPKENDGLEKSEVSINDLDMIEDIANSITNPETYDFSDVSVEEEPKENTEETDSEGKPKVKFVINQPGNVNIEVKKETVTLGNVYTKSPIATDHDFPKKDKKKKDGIVKKGIK